MKKYITLLLSSTILLSCGDSKELEQARETIEIQNLKIDSLKTALDDSKNGADKLYGNLLHGYKENNYSIVKTNYNLLKEKHAYFKDLDKATEIYNKIIAKEEAEKKQFELEQKKTVEEKAKSLTKLKKSFDDVGGVTWYKNTYFKHNIDTNKTSIYMGQRKGDSPWLRLVMSYTGDDWIFFDNAYLSYDGNTIEIPYDKYQDKKSDNGYGGVWEWIDVTVTPDILLFLEQMTQNGKGKMRLSGKYTKTRDLTPNEIKGIKDVINGYNYLKYKID